MFNYIVTGVQLTEILMNEISIIKMAPSPPGQTNAITGEFA